MSLTQLNTLCESKYIEWKIPKFFDMMQLIDEVESVSFSFSEAKWCLTMHTNLKQYPNCMTNEWIGLFLVRKAAENFNSVNCRIVVKNTNGTEFKADYISHTFEKTKHSKTYGLPRFLEKSKLLSFQKDVAPGGILTIFCKLEEKNRAFVASSAVECASQTHPVDTLSLIQDFTDLYISRRHADVKITVKDKEFGAHRCILSSRSSVFRSMFSHDMKEKHNGSISISDCDQETFEDFLIFMYTGKLDFISINNALSLYRTADKYDVKELKDKCVRYMAEELTNDLFCDVLHLATMQKETDLLKAVTGYFINNAKSIIITNKWQNFLAEHPILGNELFLKLLESKANIDSNK